MSAELERAHERQELASRRSRERVARLHLYLQGGPIPPTDEERRWVKEWFSDLHDLVQVREETGSIPPSSEYHMERARRFIAGDLDALLEVIAEQESGES